MKTLAVVTAAGAGLRMGTARAKQFLDLCGKPVLAVTLEAFERSPAVHTVNLVVPEPEVGYCRREIVQRYRLGKVGQVIAGGRRRQDSVRHGLEASAEAGFEFAMIHDGVRPLLEPDLIERLSKAVKQHGAVIAALPAKDTVKEVDSERVVRKTCDRRHLWLVQTPQAFRYEVILKAHRMALDEGWDEATDDALLLEKMGIPVRIIEGEEDNIKVTTPYDLELARFLLRRREENVRR